MKFGFIGLGSLGTPIALNLVETGHEVFVYNRTISKTKPLADKGAKVCNSIAELAKECSIIFTIVADDAALNAVTADKDGLVANMAKDALHISMSTILPQTAADLSALRTQYGQHYLSAPVFGRPEAAVARKLNFVISGDDNSRQLAEPLLKDAGATGVWHFGETITAANVVKLCGNFLIAAALEAMGESIVLAKESGVDPQTMWGMFTQTLFNTPMYHNYSNIILQQKFEPAAFTAKLGLKDMRLVGEQAATVHQNMSLVELLKAHMKNLVDTGKENIDWSAVSLGGRK